ncbi:sensor domain-containing protein [Streptomyces sp. SP17BM10]|uniref:sensor histidine kinase n=1 Tax=Streptomyces sp. SP17BM10 TaxID=3002530 RepID=UPI002E770A79|nr:sensor domain-containing protein [Streptomyces sp. SP17BM10]MEE1783457.1 sensor domain-containing protein [Streptomyces sp. SP17BM10]
MTETASRQRRACFSLHTGEWAFAALGLPLALLGGVYAVAVLYVGALLSLTVLGLPFVVVALLGARGIGTLHRWLVARLLGVRVEQPTPLPGNTGVFARGRAVLTDPVAWRTLLYLVLRLPVGVLGFAAAVGLPLACGWLIGFPLWARLLDGPRPADWLDTAPLVGLALAATVPASVRATGEANRWLARLLLGPARAQQRVRELESARAALLAENTDQLRRLERDLHDGTQARLVALAITLSLAADAVGDTRTAAAPDAERLRTLVDRARGQTDDTIAELRRLTRGIHPVALDGGLGEALPGLTATSPVPVAVALDLRERPDPAVERAVYFCAAELLTNVAKHSGAQAAELTAHAADGRIRLTVRDDGRGGAALGTGAAPGSGPGGGTGLAGLAERLAAVDGVLRIDSPPGGPTAVTAELPMHL